MMSATLEQAVLSSFRAASTHWNSHNREHNLKQKSINNHKKKNTVVKVTFSDLYH